MRKLIRSMPVSRILLIVYGLLIVVLGVVRLIEYRSIKQATDTLHELTTTSAQRDEIISQLLNNNNTIRISELLYLYSRDSSQVHAAKETIQALVRSNRLLRDEYQHLIQDSVEQHHFDQILIALREIHSLRKDIFGLSQERLTQAARDIDSREMQQSYENFRKRNMALSAYVIKRDEKNDNHLKQNLVEAVKLTRTVSFILAVLLIILGFIILQAVQTIIRKKNQLATAEQRQRLFIEQTNEIIISLDPEGQIRFGNKKVKSLLNCTESELRHLNGFDLMTDNYAHAAREAFRNHNKDGVIHVPRCKIKSRNGNSMVVEGNLIWDYESGTFAGATCFLNDVTEKVRLQKSLKNSEHKFRELFNMAPIPMYTFDPGSLRFLQVNAAAVEQYGYSEQEFLKKTIYDIRPEGEFDRTAEAIRAIIEENKNYNAYYRHLIKDGSLRDVEIFASRIMLHNRPVVMTTVVDVTSRKLHENRITQAIIKTQEEERYEIGSELHDNVCQLLASAQMSMGMIKNQLSGESKAYYTQALESITLAGEEIRNLSHRLAPVFFKNSSLKDSFIRLINTFNIGNSFSVNLYFDEAVEELSLTRELQLNLYRILQEQLRNILKYARATEIRLDVLLHGGNLHMLIGDNGVGFNPESTPQGIGLANMRRRVEFFNGKMAIYSAPEEGCEIMVVIPVDRS